MSSGALVSGPAPPGGGGGRYTRPMTTNFGRAGRAVSVVVVLGLAGGLSACAGGGAKGPAGDPLEVVRSHQANPAARAEAIGQAVRNAEKDPSSGVALHNALMTVAWDPAEAPPLRAVAIRTLLAQPEGASLTEAKAQAMVVLPRESSREVVQTICRAAGARGWKDFTPSIVRSYARVVPLVPNEEDRSEREALVALYPGRAVDEVVFDVFASPPARAAGPAAGLGGPGAGGRVGRAGPPGPDGGAPAAAGAQVRAG